MACMRNNIRVLPYEAQRLVSKMLVKKDRYDEIRTALAPFISALPKPVTIHNSSILAWSKSADYIRYRTACETDEQESAIVRAQAEALNDGRGPESMADLTCMEVIRELYRQTKAGGIKDLGDLANVTKALAPLLRAKIAQDLAASRTRETALKKEIETLKAAHDAERISLEEEIAKLQQELANLKAGGKVDFKQAAANVAKILEGGN